VTGTKEYGLHYARLKEGRPTLVGYSDADMVGDINNRKSTNEVLFFLDGNLVEIIYPEYCGPPVTAQNSGYDRFPPAANDLGTIHPILGNSLTTPG
jgi:predicted SnoaL-like aldol condensation-catalyzing enzyme